MKHDIIKWLINGRVGASSRVMAARFANVKTDKADHPHDPDDFNRCLLFFEAVPDARRHMYKLKDISKVWARLVDNWHDIEASFLDEVGLDWCKDGRATKTYKLMRAVILP